jgi:hypothetical protein
MNGVYVVGVYGSGATCSAMLKAGLAHLGWLSQSTGWDGYSQFTTWVIKQGPEQAIRGLNSDSDTAHGRFGEFRVPQPQLSPET